MGTFWLSHWIGCLWSGAPPPLNFLERQSKHFALDWENAGSQHQRRGSFRRCREKQKERRSLANKCEKPPPLPLGTKSAVSLSVPLPLILVFFLQLTGLTKFASCTVFPECIAVYMDAFFERDTWMEKRGRRACAGDGGCELAFCRAHRRVWFGETRRLSATFRSAQEGFNFQSIYFLCLWD